MKRYRTYKFTLVELLAAMAVFSVLLLVSMRLFSGSQRLWVRAEQKTDTFANARIAMEFMTSRLQTMVYFGDVPFGMRAEKVGDTILYADQIWFASGLENRENKGYYLQFRYYLQFIRFALDDRGKLVMKIYSDYNNRRNFPLLFPPYDNNPYCSTWQKAWNKCNEVWADSGNNTRERYTDEVEIIENVTSLKFAGRWAWYDDSDSKWKLKSIDDIYAQSLSSAYFYEGKKLQFSSGTESSAGYADYVVSPPYLLEIELSIIDNKENYEKWKKASSSEEKNEIFAEYGYTFRRAVLLSQRSQ